MVVVLKSRVVRLFLLLFLSGVIGLLAYVFFCLKVVKDQDIALLGSRLGIARKDVLHYKYETGGIGDGYSAYVIVRWDEAANRRMEKALLKYSANPDSFLGMDFQKVGNFRCENIRHFFRKRGIEAVFKETDKPNIIWGYDAQSILYLVPDVSKKYGYIEIEAR